MATNPIAQAISPFIWGRGGAALTPEQVAREREIAEALIGQGIDTSPVGHWTQGAARMANVLAGKLKEGRASRAETEGRSAQDALRSGLDLSSIFGGAPSALSGSPATSTSMATMPAPDIATARVAQAHGGASIPSGERADYIRQGLIERGLPNHVADAFLMNFQDESGLNPGINEVSPLVPGSRGGYGLYQLTGPRRREYEAFAQQRGVPLDDIDAQLDFLMQEGSSTERGAFDRILVVPDTGTAAVEIVNSFLRPAKSHRESRAARYSSAPNTAVQAVDDFAAGELAGVGIAETEADILAQEAAMAAQDPMAFQQPAMPMGEPQMVQDRPVADIAQALTNNTVNPDLPMAGNTSGFLLVAQSLSGGGNQLQQVMELASSPWATDMDRMLAKALMQQQVQASDPMRQLQMERAQLEIDALRNPAAPKPIEVGGVLLDPITFQPIFDSRQQAGPTSVQEYQFYANQAAERGEQPMPYDQWDVTRRQSGATQVNVGGDGAPGLGKLSADYGYVLDPATRMPVIDQATGLPQAAPVPGSPAAIAAAEAERMRAGQEGQAQRYGRIVGEDIGEVLRAVEENPNLVSGPIGSLLSSLPGTGAHDVSAMLNTIRANVGFDRLQAMRASSPTGGALGAVSDSENKMLQSTLGALEQSQSPQQFARNLRRLQNLYTEIVHGPAPDGVSDDEWTRRSWGIDGHKGNRTSSGIQWSIE